MTEVCLSPTTSGKIVQTVDFNNPKQNQHFDLNNDL